MEKREKLPLIALRDLIIFPRMVTHFDCGREKSVSAVEHAEMNGSIVLLVSQKNFNEMNPTREDLYDYGTIATIKQILKLPGGIIRVLVEGVSRAKIKELSEDGKFFEATYEEYEEETEFDEKDSKSVAAMRLIIDDLEEYSELDQKLIPGLLKTVVDDSTPSALVDTAVAYINVELKESQKLLEILDPYERMIYFHGILKKEIELLAIEKNIDTQVKDSMNQVQKEYYLKEQLRVIHKELGDDSYEDDVTALKEKIENKNLPEAVKEKALKEVSRMSKTNSASPEYSVISNYLDWILELPWNEQSEEDFDLEKAKKILDKEHYGLKNVKERILEFMAVRKLTENSKGPILCLVGPPGVGKTSIAASISHSLGKEFVRMSLGGVTDEAEIRGHRRTYIGSMPGRIISLLKKAKQKDPVFLFDEIDKVGSDYKGDPASGLLEVLDPEQNKTFTDHYLEVPFDLSNIFFITTANTTSTIPRPLLDRMEIIQLSGYTPDEKFNIAKSYLLPKQTVENGLKKTQFKVSDRALRDVINYYTREAGVRGLEKELSKIARKAVLEIIEGKEKISITPKNLNEYLGEKKYLFDIIDKEDQVGIVNGLAWTEVGGVSLQIETTIMEGSGKITLTGKLGDVMKESAIAAISYIASNADKYGIDPSFRTKSDIHIHVPEGAVPKDGPSAGITMITSVLSALTNRPVNRDIAMTGEITLRGRVLPIGGLKEKLLAAERMGIKKVLIPYDNLRDLKEIEDDVIESMEIIGIKRVEEAEKYTLKEKK